MYANASIKALHTAVRDDNLQAVLKILDKGTYVDAEDASQVRPIHIAAELGHLNIVKALIARGCDVNAQAPCTGTAITRCQNMEERLTKFYSTMGSIREYIENPLSSMLSAGVSFVSCVNNKFGFVASPLHIAVEHGYLSIVKALVSANADVNSADNCNKRTPLFTAVEGNYEDIAKFLLQNRAVVNARDKHHWTPLHCAAEKGYFIITKLLIQNKAAINAKTLNGATPLHVAISNTQSAVSEFLINGGADVNARNNEGCTPLLLSTQRVHQTETARLLIAKGADVNAKNGILRTPLYCAAENNFTDIVNLLIKNKADVNVTDDRKWTPLHGAANAGNLDIIKILIASGAEVDPLSHKQATPLHLAAASWHVEVVKYLLAKGAEVNAADHRSWTPLHFVANERTTLYGSRKAHGSKVNTMKALIENGAHVNARGSNGETAVYLAIKIGDQVAAGYLLRNGAYNSKPQPPFEDNCALS